jgi:hypothetical protein
VAVAALVVALTTERAKEKNGDTDKACANTALETNISIAVLESNVNHEMVPKAQVRFSMVISQRN